MVRGSVVLKVWMALTGLFLTLFLVVHWVGNLQLFLPEAVARPSFNAYADVLTSNLVIKVAGWATYASVLLHAAVAAVLSWRHRSVRQRYAVDGAHVVSPWRSRSMGVLGAAILGFLALHLHGFWYRYHWGEMPVDTQGHKDLYTVVVAAFSEPWVVAVYVVAMIALGLHLHHGVAAALGSLGVFSVRIGRAAPRVSAVLGWTLAGGFAAMPIYVLLVHGGYVL